MIVLIGVLVFATVSLLTYAAVAATRPQSPAVRARLAEIGQLAPFLESALAVPRRRRRERLEAVLRRIGERTAHRGRERRAARRALVMAGFRHPDALALYYGLRVVSALALPAGVVVIEVVGGSGVPGTGLLVAGAAALGWFLPRFALKARIRRRQERIRLALADALDLLVICVEAGLGLNQALARVTDEMIHASGDLGRELQLVNLEMRAGTARADALRHLGERTGVDDLQSLVSMLIQTDRFGTSIAQSLRTHSDALRTKRRQRAEEAAAKTTIKLVFPLVLFVFPAMFVVIIGPAMLHILEQLSGVAR